MGVGRCLTSSTAHGSGVWDNFTRTKANLLEISHVHCDDVMSWPNVIMISWDQIKSNIRLSRSLANAEVCINASKM